MRSRMPGGGQRPSIAKRRCIRRCRPARCACLALVIGLPIAVLGAQNSPPLAPGARVRVIRPDPGCGAPGAFWCKRWKAIGTLVSIDSQTVHVRDATGMVVTVPRVVGAQFEVSTGPGLCGAEHRPRCAGVGLLSGAVLGTLSGALWVHSRRTSCTENCGLAYLVSVPVGAAVGTLVGAMLGREPRRSEGIAVPEGRRRRPKGPEPRTS